MEFSLILERNRDNSHETLGTLKVVDKHDKVILSLTTLELPWLLNQPRISCIPRGTFVVKPHFSPSKGKCLSILNVEKRANILIHSGNYKGDTLGCVLVGLAFADINFDNEQDITHSRKALNMLLTIITEPTTISIFYAVDAITTNF